VSYQLRGIDTQFHRERLQQRQAQRLRLTRLKVADSRLAHADGGGELRLTHAARLAQLTNTKPHLSHAGRYGSSDIDAIRITVYTRLSHYRGALMSTKARTPSRRHARTTSVAPLRRSSPALESEDAIPYLEPDPLPDGLHIAPWRSWDGAPMLVVISRGGAPFPPLRIAELRSPISDDPFPYSAQWLAGYHRTWDRGVYLDPTFADRDDRAARFLAIDSHGRNIHITIARTEQERPSAIYECRQALLREDPIMRPRPRGQTRF
jgi:hypothetical protein